VTLVIEAGRTTRAELQRAAAVRASRPRTMDEHFAELFARYQSLAPQHVRPATRPYQVGELALAR